MSTFAKRLVLARKKMGWSQAKLAAIHGGIKKAAVYIWEKGELINGRERLPSSNNLQRLAEVLQVDVKWLRFGDDLHNQPKDDKNEIDFIKNISIIVPPILEDDEIGAWLEKHRQHLLQKGVSTMLSIEEREAVCFEVINTSDSMLAPNDPIRSLIIGEILKIDPTFPGGLNSGDYVLAKYGNGENYKPRIYEKDGKDTYLIALNPEIPRVEIGDDKLIVGKIISTRRNKN